MFSIGYSLLMPRPLHELEQFDRALASLAQEEAVLRLHLGQALEVIARGAVFDLGFSSLAAYAIERCECSARWAEGARCLARRVEQLPRLRTALVSGRVSWSMSELLARVAQPDDEARWLEMAAGQTVRQMRVLVSKAQPAGAARADEPRGAADGDDDDPCMLVCTVNREEAWLFEATRSLLEHLGVRDADAQGEALLAEAQETLLGALPSGALEIGDRRCCEAAQQRWLTELRRWRDEAEECCEANVLRSVQSGLARGAGPHEKSRALRGAWSIAAARGISALEREYSSKQLDRRVRTLHAALSRHELELSLRVLHFHRADGWRQLGYATEAQYARERLGMSRSSFRARCSLALRLEKLPAIGAALGAGQIGVEAAFQLVRVATPNTQAAWVDRARKRTIKHLKQEVAAALTAIRWSAESDCPPPDDGEMKAFDALERAVVSGGGERVREKAAEGVADVQLRASDASQSSPPKSGPRRAWRVMLGSLASWLAAGGVQMSAAGTKTAGSRASANAGRVTLRLRMSRATRAWWRALEAAARRWLPPTINWLTFSCLSLWRAWRHALDADVAYAHIYVRDRYRCTSPVCNRRDVTPHHLTFRSAGGGAEDENVAAVCTWCHLHGIHGGRIRASGTAALIHWEIGAQNSPCLVVHGRERVAA